MTFVILVLGQTLNSDGSMPPCLEQRLDVAGFLYHHQVDQDPVVICCGGKVMPGVDESEAMVMSRYLWQKQGVDPERMILEEQSMTTAENFINAMEIIKGLGDVKRVEVVTSGFHSDRAKHIASTLLPLEHTFYVPRYDCIPTKLHAGAKVGSSGFQSDINKWNWMQREEHERLLLERLKSNGGN